MTIRSIFAWLSAFLFASFYSVAGNPFGTGVDGPLTVGTGATVTTDDDRTHVDGRHIPGMAELTVTDASLFEVNDEIIIITMLDPELDLAANRTGIYELRTITAINGNDFTLDRPLGKTFDSTNGQIHQVVRIPHYTDVTVDGTLTCSHWNGSSGGVLFFRATGTVTVTPGGLIDGNARGYRGAEAISDNQSGRSGEGTTGNYNNLDSTWAGNGAGPGYGGGGGGHATDGQGGGSPNALDNFGRAVGEPALSRLYMGGAGAGGTDDDSNYNNGNEGTGGDGGGIIVIAAPVINADRIRTNGEQGYAPDSRNSDKVGADGAGGGGAGGTIWLISRSATVTALEVAGGEGGESITQSWPFNHPHGGDGSVGRVRIDADAIAVTDTTVAAFEGGFPNIAHVALPDTPDENGPYPVAVHVHDDEGDVITGVSLFYRVSPSAYTEVPMTDSGDNVLWTAQIPGHAAGSVIDYYFTATDGTDNYALPTDAPTSSLSFTITALPPIDISTTANSDGSITLAWLPPVNVTNLTGYSVYRGTAPGFVIDGGSQIATGITDLNFTDSAGGLLDFTTYYYVVTADYDIGGTTDVDSVATSEVANVALTKTIRGYVQLEGQTGHAGITVRFSPASQAADQFGEQTTTTNALGFYEIVVPSAVWTVTYENAAYHPYDVAQDLSIIDDIDFGTTTLFYLGNANISGDVSGEWDGLYSVSGNINVPAGETLTIRAGSEIRFLGNYDFDVFGELRVLGEAGNEVLFTPLRRDQTKAPGHWGGIDFEDSSDDNSIIQHVIIEYAVDGVYWDSAMATVQNALIRYCSSNGLDFRGDASDGTVSDIEVHGTTGDGIYLDHADPTMTRINSHDNTNFGIYCYNYAHPTVNDSFFNHNNSHGIRLVDYCYPIFDNCEVIGNSSWGIRSERCFLTIRNSTISENASYGIAINYSNQSYRVWAKIENCLFEDNSSTAIYFVHWVRHDSIIRNNTIRHNGGNGIYLYYYAQAEIIGNRLFDNNSHGISFANNSHNRYVVIENNVIAYSNGDGIYKNTSTTSDPIIRNNTIYQNVGDGIELNGTGTETVSGNLIINNGGFGIRTNTFIESLSFNNVFENTEGTLSNSANAPTDAFVFSGTTNRNGTDADNYLNIQTDPGFVLADNEDFTLLPTSASIDAGDGATPDADGTPADLGALFRDQGIPRDVALDGQANETVSLSWTAPTTTLHGTLDSYNVHYREAAVGGAYSNGGNTVNTTFNVPNLTNNTEYEFAVSAVYDGGAYESPLSPPITGIPGVPGIEFDPTSLNVAVTTNPTVANLNITNTGTRDLDVDLPLGMRAGSVYFDGSNDYIYYGSGGHLTGFSAFTIETWIYRYDKSSHQEILGQYHQSWGLYISGGRFGMYKGIAMDPNDIDSGQYQSWTTPYEIPIGEWHHLAVTWTGHQITFYADGEIVAEYDDVVSTPVPNRNWRFWVGRTETGNYLYGHLSEVRVWNIVRTQDEIRRWINSPLKGDEPGLQGYWPFHGDYNDATGQTSPTRSGAVTHSNTAPTLPLLDFTVDQETLTVGPGQQEAITFSFDDTGENGTFEDVSPLLTNLDGDNSSHRIDDLRTSTFYNLFSSGPRYEEIEFALTYGSQTPPNPEHFVPVAATTVEYDLVITDVDLDQAPLAIGDEIGVFDGALCVGAAIYDGTFNLVVTAYGEDGGDAGFTPGNPITFKLWDVSAQLEATATADYSIGNGQFGYNEFSALSIDGTVFKTQDIDFTGNEFNLISFNKLPRFSSAAVTFANVNDLTIAYDDRGGALIPEYSINSIGDIDFRDAYYVHTTATQTVGFEGSDIDPASYPITLEPGKWNAVAFLGDAPQDVETAFIPAVLADIDMIQADDGGVFNPSLAINTIGNLLPGKGYQISLSAASSTQFTYQITGPAGGGSRSAARTHAAATVPTYFSPIAPTGLVYTILLVNPTIDGVPAEPGTEIAAYDGDICVGATVYNGDGNYFVLPTWQGSASAGLPGFAIGNTITFKFATPNGEIVDATADFLKGDGTFGSDNYSLATLRTGVSSVPVVTAVSVSDPSQTVSGVTNQRLIHLSIQGGDFGNSQFLVTESPVQPSVDAEGWQTTVPDSYSIAGDAGPVTIYVWVKNNDGIVSQLHAGSFEHIVYAPPGLTFQVTLTNANVDTLTFGEWAYATDGFDANLDEAFPSSSARGIVDSAAAVFLERLDVGDIERYVTDIRPVDGDTTRWRLRVQPGVSQSVTVQMRFSVFGATVDLRNLLGDREIILTQIVNERPGPPIVLDDGMTLDVRGDTVYEIALGTPVTRQLEQPENDQWTLVSFPSMTSSTLGELLGDPTAAVWQWSRVDGRFQHVPTDTVPNAEQGYWVLSNGNRATFDGILSDGRVSLLPGWNVIGPSEPSILPGNDAIGDRWTWDANSGRLRLANDEPMQPGQGYLVFARESITVDLQPVE